MEKTKPPIDQLSELLVTELVKRIKDGTASSADLSVARGLLRDNNILLPSHFEDDLEHLKDSLPENALPFPSATIDEETHSGTPGKAVR